jgi:hypothetical protein
MKYLIFILFVFLTGSECYAQKMTEQEVKALVDGGSYFFRAQNMYPTGARSKVINETYYTLIVKPEELTADLPYAGRAYQAPANPAEVGVKFTSKDFAVEKKITKKGDQEFRFTPKDVQDVRECLLTVYNNGNANVVFTFNQRQTISYQGIILPLDQNK